VVKLYQGMEPELHERVVQPGVVEAP